MRLLLLGAIHSICFSYIYEMNFWSLRPEIITLFRMIYKLNYFILVTFLLFSSSICAQYEAITGSSISNDNLKINIVFDEEIYSNSSCSTLTCIEVTDFILSLSGGEATLGSYIPTTITKLGNYDFVPKWNGGEPNDAGNENYAQHTTNGTLNDLNNSRNLPGVLELINPLEQIIPGYTYITAWPVGSECAHTYYRSNTTGSWTSQKAQAQAAGGDLLVYNSVEEYEYFVPPDGEVGGFANTNGVADTWIGLSQDVNAADYSEPSGGWYWDDGTPMDNSAAKITYQITFSLVGTPTGDELVTVTPVTSPQSVFNCAGTVAGIQTNGLNKVNLIDKTDPYSINTSVVENNTSITIRFQEDVFADANGTALTAADFALSLAQNGSTADLTSPTPLSVLVVNNSTFILELPLNGNHITGNEVITALPASGTSLFDAAGNPASMIQINNSVQLNPTKTGPIYLGMNYKSSTVSGTLLEASYTFLCDENAYNNYNIAYHNGPLLEPSVGEYLIFNFNYDFEHQLISGDNFAYMHLRDYDKIIEVRKSDGLIVAKYSCN